MPAGSVLGSASDISEPPTKRKATPPAGWPSGARTATVIFCGAGTSISSRLVAARLHRGENRCIDRDWAEGNTRYSPGNTRSRARPFVSERPDPWKRTLVPPPSSGRHCLGGDTDVSHRLMVVFLADDDLEQAPRRGCQLNIARGLPGNHFHRHAFRQPLGGELVPKAADKW